MVLKYFTQKISKQNACSYFYKALCKENISLLENTALRLSKYSPVHVDLVTISNSQMQPKWSYLFVLRPKLTTQTLTNCLVVAKMVRLCQMKAMAETTRKHFINQIKGTATLMYCTSGSALTSTYRPALEIWLPANRTSKWPKMNPMLNSLH